MKNVSNSIGLLAIALLFVGSVLLNNVLFDRARIDLTENSIYSISDGTKELLTQLDEPINLYFFFSNKNSEGITSVRTYAARVQSVLDQNRGSFYGGGFGQSNRQTTTLRLGLL